MLPYHLDYSASHPTIDPESYTINTSSVPINGSSFSAGSIISVLIPKQDLLVPDSLHIKYILTPTTGTIAGFVAGCPVYTAFSKVETLIGGQSEETLMSHNVVQNFIMNTNYNYAQKYALESAYGYTSATTQGACNGHQMTGVTEAISMSAPLNNCLSNCKQYIPLALMGQSSILHAKQWLI